MPKLTIDGKQIEVPPGTRLIEAAKMMDTDIPFYCYHPGLSVAGNCRMCLVEVEKMPKLQISCHMQAQDGMVVHTKSPRVLNTRKHILEFLLVNHPLDCPVCDQAGECWLQDYYMRHGLYDSRVHENKVKKHKAVPLGETVMLDAERCILCSRCVRFCDEVSKTSELGIVNRGDHSEIQVFPEKDLNNPYSGNVVDICPVGALTDRDFRFKIRVWYLKTQETLCNGCSQGCNVHLQYNTDRPHHAKGERVMRLKPRYNEHVNQWWICDEGRYGYRFHDHNRILKPLKRMDRKVSELSWDQTLNETAELLEKAQGRIGVMISPQMSNEEIFFALQFFRDKLKVQNLHLVKSVPDGKKDDLLMKADKNPNSKGAELLGLKYNDKTLSEFFAACEKGNIEGLVVFGQDLLTLHGAHLAETGFKNLKWSVFIGSNHNVMSEYAQYVLPSATYAEKEGTFTNYEGRVQKFNPAIQPIGESKTEWEILAALASKMQIHFHYDNAEEIFHELSLNVKVFRGLTYENLGGGGSDLRRFAAPMIPKFVQKSDLIFDQAIEIQSVSAPAQPAEREQKKT